MFHRWHDIRLSRASRSRQPRGGVFQPSMPRPISSRWQRNSIQTWSARRGRSCWPRRRLLD